MNKLTELIKNDMKPAFGVTEPGAIAFAVATARKHVRGKLVKVSVAMNSGMYKNAFTCGIPNSVNYGNLYAAALGAVAADSELGLESLSNITPEDDRAAEELVNDGMVEAYMDHIGSEITIDATVETDEGSCTVHIRHSHTHIESIELNGAVIYEDAETCDDEADADEAQSGGSSDGSSVGSSGEANVPLIHKYTLAELVDYVKTVPAEEIEFIRDAFDMNLELLEEGLNSGRAGIAESFYEENGNKLYSEDVLKSAQLLCNGAIEARVLGLSRPAMSITGSGSHGIIATMPLYAYYKIKNTGEELLLRATALAYLITMYIKEYSGKLSAFCGCGIAAGTGMAMGLAYMRGADIDQLEMVLLNMSSGITGMICDGGNHGCAVKGMVATDAAFRAVDLAMRNVCIEAVHGINGLTPEDTMRNMGLIASPGMVKTEGTIVEIMENK